MLEEGRGKESCIAFLQGRSPPFDKNYLSDKKSK
jgi:hypothetical protein